MKDNGDLKTLNENDCTKLPEGDDHRQSTAGNEAGWIAAIVVAGSRAVMMMLKRILSGRVDPLHPRLRFFPKAVWLQNPQQEQARDGRLTTGSSQLARSGMYSVSHISSTCHLTASHSDGEWRMESDGFLLEFRSPCPIYVVFSSSCSLDRDRRRL